MNFKTLQRYKLIRSNECFMEMNLNKKFKWKENLTKSNIAYSQTISILSLKISYAFK